MPPGVRGNPCKGFMAASVLSILIAFILPFAKPGIVLGQAPAVESMEAHPGAVTPLEDSSKEARAKQSGYPGVDTSGGPHSWSQRKCRTLPDRNSCCSNSASAARGRLPDTPTATLPTSVWACPRIFPTRGSCASGGSWPSVRPMSLQQRYESSGFPFSPSSKRSISNWLITRKRS